MTHFNNFAKCTMQDRKYLLYTVESCWNYISMIDSEDPENNNNAAETESPSSHPVVGSPNDSQDVPSSEIAVYSENIIE